jgi:hypothetical protein
MDRVQKPSNSECYTPSSKPFRIYFKSSIPSIKFNANPFSGSWVISCVTEGLTESDFNMCSTVMSNAPKVTAVTNLIIMFVSLQITLQVVLRNFIIRLSIYGNRSDRCRCRNLDFYLRCAQYEFRPKHRPAILRCIVLFLSPHWTGWRGGKELGTCSGGSWFESQSAHWLSWVRISWFSSVLPWKCQNSISIRSRLLSPYSLPIHSFINLLPYLSILHSLPAGNFPSFLTL